MSAADALKALLQHGTELVLQKVPLEDLLAPSKQDVGAYLVLFENEAAVKAGEAQKTVFMPSARIEAMVGATLPSFTYDKNSDVVVVAVVCGVGEDGEGTFHYPFVFTSESK
jgi:uncharacterized protein YfaP (DUF2135 family)